MILHETYGLYGKFIELLGDHEKRAREEEEGRNRI